jgi:UBX domain-containing protein 1
VQVSEAAERAKSVKVDPASPTTTLQVKLLDGRREKIVLNLHNTVEDLQAIVASLKGTSKDFVLAAGFPPKPLSNGLQTIEEAGLKGAAVTQQLP